MGVLAHEISHINRRYIVEKFNIRGDDGAMLDTVGIVGGSTQTSRLALDGVVSQVMDMLLMDGLDQDEELMADQAVQFMGALIMIGVNTVIWLVKLRGIIIRKCIKNTSKFE